MYTNDEALAQKLRMIANHGQVKRYYHDLVGCNSRLDALQAAILDVKLPHLDQYAAARRAAADYYDEALGGIDALRIPHRASYSSHVFHQYTLIVEDDRRDQLQNFLREKGIPTMIYYPVPLYRQPAFRPLSEVERLPVTEALCQRVISLPIHTELKKETLEYICANIEAFFAG
jgi:dTDP-4-amino-4,6-dideoxygalactose transaminase